MPVLSNARYEIFSQEIANGTSVSKAYVKAGFRANRGNASTLNQTKAVKSRIAELLREREAAVTTQYAAEVEYSRETLLKMAQHAYDVAEELETPGPMVSAVVAMARITGNIIDRRELGPAGAFDGYTDEELIAEAARRARELGIVGPRLVEDDNKKSL